MLFPQASGKGNDTFTDGQGFGAPVGGVLAMICAEQKKRLAPGTIVVVVAYILVN